MSQARGNGGSLNQSQGMGGSLVGSVRRGMSQSKNRDKALLNQQQQKPPQDADEQLKSATGQGDNNAQIQTNTMNQTKNLLTKRQKKPAYLQSLNEHEKAENFKIIDNMSKKISYLKNPRFKINKAPIIMTEAGKDEVTDQVNPFRIEPKIVQFVDYQVNGVYEIPIKVTNASSISRRIKFIPPTTDNFTVKNIKYPSKETGDIAPGMSLILSVSFSAPSFADFDDYITFVTDENSFKIPLRARRDPPVISLVNPLDCLQSWLGDRVDMAFRCQNTGGDGGFKFFCERDEDDSKQSDSDTIRIGSFTLTPAEFYLYSGNAIDIYVSFAPEEEGQHQENLILACDNQTSEFYKLTGYGAKLDLDIIAVDGKDIDFKKNPFSTLFFENTNPRSETKRVLRIKNSSPILIPFHWSLYKTKNTNKISISHEDTHYRIEPTQGKIQGGQYVDFTIHFCPQHAEPYYEFADLIVEDIPIQSIRNPPDGLKLFAANNVQKAKVPMPTYVGSNTQFLSIPIISFNMRGQGNSCKIQLSPPVLFLEGDNFINHVYTQKVNLLKTYEGSVKYKLRMEGKNSEAFSVNIKAQGQQLSQLGGVIEGQINNESQIELEVQLSSSEIGEKMAYFFIEVEDGEPATFQCKANFTGPILRLVEPIVDYGLVKINTSQKYRINIENTSPVVAEILVKNSKNKRLTFQNMNAMAEEDQQAGGQGINHFKTFGGNTVKVDELYKVMKPFEKCEILLTLDCVKTELLDEYFEIIVKDSDSQFFNIRADVQKPRVTLNRNVIELGRIYAGITEVIDYDHKQSITMKNFGNLPASFCWEEKYDSDNIIARFEPSRGVIAPKSEIQIYFSSTVYFGGNVDELFICDIDDLEIPLGFELKADAFGLNVCYEVTDTSSQSLSLSPGARSKLSTNSLVSIGQTNATGDDQKSMMSGGTNNTVRRGRQSVKQQEANKLKMLNFPGCTINKSSSQKFILKNLSGIKTQFKFSSYNFEPLSHVPPQQKSEIQIAQEDMKRASQQMSEPLLSSPDSKQGSPFKGSKQIRFAPSAKSGNANSTGFGKSTLNKSGQKSTQKFNRAILSDEHEQTQKFSSATGETFTATKKVEKEQTFFLSNNKGIAVVFSPHMGDLPPHSEIPITVTIYNNVCGKFDDKIISEVKGLPPVEFPIIIGISGSPVVIPPNQVGLNYKTFPPTLPMPTIVTNTQPIQKTFKIKNTGIRAVDVNWKIFDQKDLVKKDTDFFTLSVVKNFSFDRKENPFKFNFQAVEPEESQDSAFEIEPKQITVNSRQTQIFTVTFNPAKGIGEFKSIILASPELSKEELELVDTGDDLLRKGALGIISLNLLANAIKPVLTIDKKHSVDGDTHIKFKYWSVPQEEDAPSAIKKIIYTNNTKADLTFNLTANGPFEIVKTKSNTGAKHPLETQQTPSKLVKKKVQTMFSVQPLKIVEIHVKFMTPAPSNGEDWPMTIKNEREGELITHFTNGEQQRLALDGLLMRPKLDLLTEKPSKNDQALDELEFGTVNVDKFRTIKVFLSNITHVTAKWQLNYVKFPKKSTIGYSTTTPWEEENLKKVDDPDVFEFSLTSGALKGKSLPLRKLPEGLSLAPLPKDDYEKQFLPQTVQINFRPKANVLYKSKFRFTVENGISCDVILKGVGSYEEQHD